MRPVSLALACAAALHGPGAQAAPLQAEQDALQSYTEARQALRDNRLDEAELLLERVLMLMPEHAEARLEFALLLARRGQPEAARALIIGLAQDPRTTAAYREQLLALAGRLSQAASAAAWAAGESQPPASVSDGSARPFNGALKPAPQAQQALWRAEASLTASTNPLARTGAEGISITLPDGPVTLPLSSRPQAATVAGAALVRAQGTGGFELTVQRMDVADTATAFRAAAWGEWPQGLPWPQWAQPLRQGLGMGAVQWQLQTLRGFDNLHRHSAALAWPLGATSQGAQGAYPAPSMAGGQERLVLGAYQEPTQQDHGWLLRMEHRFTGPSALSGSVPVIWQASAERSASTARPQGYWRLNLALEAPLGRGRRLQAQFTAQEDTHPYSPLLENNSRRRLMSHYVVLEQQLTADARRSGAGLLLRLFVSQRFSNLAIFAYRDAGAQLAVAQQW